MNDTRLVFLGLILLLGATFPVSAHSADVVRPAPAWMSNLTVVQMLESPNDYRWMGTWDPVYDYDWNRHYGVVYVRDCDACATCAGNYNRCAACAGNYDSCDRCAARYWDRSAARDCDLCAARDNGRCDRCVVRDLDRYPYSSDYRCDLFGCGWVR
jgi:hypothetical protein